MIQTLTLALALLTPIPPGGLEHPGSSAVGDSLGELPEAVAQRFRDDLAALEAHRPGYEFWTHIFTVPDGSILYGSATDGRLLAAFPTGGDWSRRGRWSDASLRGVIDGRTLPRRLGDRRDAVADLMEEAAGPVVHNPSRGDFLTPNARRYAGFLAEWGRIYERFGVPAELGLAQAVVESGLAGTVTSEAGAIGFCQWLPRNWDRLQELTPWVIEVENQTTQAAFCAAYLAVLATKYGSFIPALSEHHAGAANVGRAVVNGTRLGADGVRERYLAGGELARDLRVISPRTYRDVLGTYGPRSFRYAEMVFGNMSTVAALTEDAAEERVFAIRTSRAVPLDEVIWRTGLDRDEARRFNPALFQRVPTGATLYVPEMVEGLGSEVSYWRAPAPEAFSIVLEEFVALEAPLEGWEDPEFEPVLQDFRRRFRETDTEEGRVMDATLGYVLWEMPLNRRVLADFRSDPDVRRLFEQGVRLREAELSTGEGDTGPSR